MTFLISSSQTDRRQLIFWISPMIDKNDIIRALQVIDKMKPEARGRANMDADGWREYIEIYAMMLAGIDDIDILRSAIIQVLSTHKYPSWPTAAEVLDAAWGIVERSMGLPTAGEAWGSTRDKFKAGAGSVENPVWEHPLVEQAVKAMGGWRLLGLSETAMADRAHFLKVYEELHKRAIEDHRTHPVVAKQIDKMRGERLGLSAGEKMKELSEKLSGKKEN
jgi:hypothetical protein